MSKSTQEVMIHPWTLTIGCSVKINCDVAFNRITGHSSTTVIARDSYGCILVGKSSSFLATFALLSKYKRLDLELSLP
ncbi:hypothetical protein V6N12_022102 [Hibiscus sabdariffa]|uniref:Uncharacterized protein n=1 Tax=Hibiscus sabdariffa TaxID=183260 RepID=A0ABR2FTV5_9ROSI